jgi:hypothetical protein
LIQLRHQSASFGFHQLADPGFAALENGSRVKNQLLVFATKSHVLFLCLLVYGPQAVDFLPGRLLTAYNRI